MRFRLGLCSPEEVAAIEAWLDARVDQDQTELTARQRAELQASLKAKVLDAIHGTASEQQFGTSKNIFTFLRYLAASVIFLLVSISIYYTVRERSRYSGQIGTLKQAPDVPPGEDGAVLTLQDGRQILLDSAERGTLSSSNGVTIKNLNGLLTYIAQGSHKALDKWNTVTTSRGRQYNLVLQDGTKVWLNSSSSISFPVAFDDIQRRVRITGEVYFEVKHRDRAGSSVPFIVAVNDTEIQVLGTHFNINAYQDESTMRTTLLEGAVKVVSAGQDIVLRPGEQAIAYRNGRVEVDHNAAVETVMAWHNGLFSFENADIQTVMRQLARWYDIEVVFETDVAGATFWGDLQRDANLSSVLKILEKSGVTVSLEGRKVRVLRVDR